MAAEEQTRKIRVTLKRSEICGTERQRQTVRGLGLRRIGDTRVLTGTKEVLGMIRKIGHLVEAEEANE
ncbi:MAG: 50S ribosomal protein L30 [Candidatus Binatia bacterium]